MANASLAQPTAAGKELPRQKRPVELPSKARIGEVGGMRSYAKRMGD
jgi:hypothetical protein